MSDNAHNDIIGTQPEMTLSSTGFQTPLIRTDTAIAKIRRTSTSAATDPTPPLPLKRNRKQLKPRKTYQRSKHSTSELSTNEADEMEMGTEEQAAGGSADNETNAKHSSSAGQDLQPSTSYPVPRSATRKRASRKSTSSSGPPTDFSPESPLAEQARKIFAIMETTRPRTIKDFGPSNLEAIKKMGFKVKDLSRWWAVGKALDRAHHGVEADAVIAAGAMKRVQERKTVLAGLNNVGGHISVTDPKVLKVGIKGRKYDLNFD